MKRRLFQLAIFLLLGAVVNVAVAWGCALGVNALKSEAKFGGVFDHQERWGFLRYSRPGAAYVFSWRRREEGAVTFGLSPNEVVPNWSGFKTPTREYESMLRDTEVLNADGRGWPMLALWSLWPDAVRQQEAIPPRVKNGIMTSLPWWSDNTPRIFPLRPIWPGFAIDTAFYAAILWLAIPGPFVLSRLIRRKRGLCVSCGNDLRSDLAGGCPECGWRRSQSATHVE